MASLIDRQADDVDAQGETIEARLQSFLSQFQSELGVLDRIIHKNKNQHRRSSYFQYLLKVRRDCKLLQSTNLEEIVNSSFLIINGNRPKQKVQLLESLKRRKCDGGGKHNFLERLQGAARLLSEMVEPMLKAAIEISTLLARSFFMGFSMTILALLARLRVLTQQILLDVVSVFNMVSSLSQKQQSVKLNQDGIEVFREYYPKNDQTVLLECVWETDKFVLLERKSEPENKNPEATNDNVMCEGLSAVEYQSIETILGDNSPIEDPTTIKTDNLSLIDAKDDWGVSEPSRNVLETSRNVSEASGKNQEEENISSLSLLGHPDPPKPKPELKNKVAFVSVKRPESLKANETGLLVKQSDGEKEDPFFSLLTGGSHKDNLF